MKRGTRKSSLSKKGTRLKRGLRDTARHGASFLPGVGLTLSVHDTVRSARKTARVVQDYGNELYKEAKRQIKRRNPFR